MGAFTLFAGPGLRWVAGAEQPDAWPRSRNMAPHGGAMVRKHTDMEPLVSVIIPVYNVFSYLHEALDSVIHQTYRNLEIIVIDDGSTDGSGEVCDEYKKDPRVTVIHQQNQGLSAARNIGLDRMTGEIVAFLDADDAFSKQMIEKMVEAMLRDNAEIVVCKYAILQTEGELNQKRYDHVKPFISSGVYDRSISLRALSDGGLNISVWNKLYQSSLWKDTRFPVGQLYEDTIIMQVLYNATKLCMISDLLYYHRRRQRSIVTGLSSRTVCDRIAAHNESLDFIKQHMSKIFTNKHLQKECQSLVAGLISQYIYYSRNEDNKIKAEQFRREIIKESCDFFSGSIITRTAWLVLKYCPCVLKVFYPCAVFISQAKRKRKYRKGKLCEFRTVYN